MIERFTSEELKAVVSDFLDRINIKDQEIQRLKEIVRIQGEALKFYAEGDGRRIVEAPSGKHWIQEYGCGCCTQSYQVDPDGTIGMMDCELDNVAGWTAREAIAQVEKLAKPEDGK